MHDLPPVRPVIESNAAFLSGKARRLKLFFPNPLFVVCLIGFFLLIFVGVLLVSLKPICDGYRLDRNGTRVNGEVVSVERYSIKSGQRYRVTYSFKDSAEGFRMSTDEGLRVGEVHGLSKGLSGSDHLSSVERVGFESRCSR